MDKIRRAHKLRELFEKYFEKSDDKKEREERRREAANKLDKVLGDKWRKMINPDGVDFLDLPKKIDKDDCTLTEEKDMAFWDRVRKLLLAENARVDEIVDGFKSFRSKKTGKPKKIEKPKKKIIRINIEEHE